MVSPDGSSLTVPGQGVWTVNPVTGELTFTPAAGFTGQPDPVKFSALDKYGNVAQAGTASVKLGYAPPSATGTTPNRPLLPTCLARTGTEAWGIGGLATLLAGIGAALHLGSRRRRK
ncbi:hypothetical protein JT358_00395 [Micrococcales bacterium 31B]|nr:hypothetical protein [Micrococcales bacterium 31B]